MISTSRSRAARLVLAATLTFLASALVPSTAGRAQTPVTHQVTWDSHSLLIDGKRVLLYSGEFHYFRLPAPNLWEDRLEKMKAAGLNAVSIYFDWQYHSSAPGQYDFSGARDIERLLEITDRLGLYVLARVGPYMNAEADAGGLPGWLLTKPLYPRSQTWSGTKAAPQYSPLYMQYAREWYDHILPIVARHQVTNGGSVLLLQIENEYDALTGSPQYMQELYSHARADGITVPIFHNDFNFNGGWSKLVDLYAFDSYPYGFICCHQWWDVHFHGIDTWENTLRQQLKITTPMFVSELQGGSFDPWGGKGYDTVAKTLDGNWLSALDESALAQGTTLLNTYMFAGGTSWGYMSDPGTYTSYDYGAPISEAGQLRPAYYAAHRLGLFLRAFGPTLAGADAAPGLAVASNKAVAVHSRVDGTSGQGFIFLRHGDAGAAVQTRLRLQVAGRSLTVPQQPRTAITLPGHGSAVLTQNAQIGPLHLNYTTSSVLTDVDTAQGNYLVLYGPQGSSGETDFLAPSGQTNVVHNAGVQVTQNQQDIRLNYTHTSTPRTVALQTPSGVLRILITSASSASDYWYSGGTLFSGAALVTDDGPTKIWAQRGQEVRAYGGPTDRPFVIDGGLSALPDAVTGTTLLGTLAAPAAIKLPAITSWRFQSEAPEISPAFDDSNWQVANHASTNNPNVPQGPSLLADDYGFHYGFVWYRGHFTASGHEAGIVLAARQSYSIYLNGQYLGSADTSLSDPPHSYAAARGFTFPPGVLKPGQENVISVLTESLGHDEGWLAGPVAQSPQGILSASLSGTSTPITWRIQGDQGGENPVDQERGLLNASGLYGERNGWYLPRYDDDQWQPVTLPDNWQTRKVSAPVGWYRAHFQLNLPGDTEEPIGLTLSHASDKAVIWVNGWLLGRYWEQRGPQHTFYLPEGILNANGDNVVAIAVWNRGHQGGLTSVPRLTAYPALREHTVTTGDVVNSSNGYWHTSGNRIVDQNGLPVRIAAVNWFGMENTYFVPAGLEHQPLTSIVMRVKQLGFNAIRLPFSNQMVEQNPIVTAHLAANPDLKGLHALDVMDKIVAAAGQVGLRVILDDQRSSAGTQPEPNGLWYTKAYPESVWIHDWQFLVNRYLGNPTVVGVDLRNEPHTAPPGPWSVKAYLSHGSTWGPYKGKDNLATDWRLAAERGGNAVLAVNPQLLVFVEGLQLYPDPTQPGGIDSYWWGGILTPARQYPVELAVPHQMVYSPHEYGPEKYAMPFFGPHMTYRSMVANWEKHWGFLEKADFPKETPIFLGEFGTCGNSGTCVASGAPGSQGLWFSFLMKYLIIHPEIGWGFWALNGTSHLNDVTPNNILKPDWKSVRLPALVQTFQDIEYAPSP